MTFQEIQSNLTSYQGLIFLALQEGITNNIPKIKWIDMEMSQLEDYGDAPGQNPRPPVLFPCVLIDFPRTNFAELGQQESWNELTLELRLAFAQFSNTSAITPMEWKEKALEYFEIESKIIALMDGFVTVVNNEPVHEPFSRMYVETERRQFDTINMRVRRMVFTAAFMDNLARPKHISLKAALRAKL